MAPVVPFVPVIAAALGAGGTVAASMIGAKASKAGGGSSMSSPLTGIKDPVTDEKSRRGILPLTANPLGDTTNPNLSRGRLLGN